MSYEHIDYNQRSNDKSNNVDRPIFDDVPSKEYMKFDRTEQNRTEQTKTL
jgi:hypothetical protein